MDDFPFARFRRALRRWHAKHGRVLPWRAAGDPYKVWISEIMLQQTTVTAVVPYFARFLARFPTLEDLAQADEQDVLRLWEGLGYYSRARNLHQAARMIASEHGGTFPSDLAALRSLPGIGRYTAGAIASFAFDLKAPILEANTLRLYSRLIGYAGDPRSKDGQTQLWAFAEQALPNSEVGAFNQALMDLGATVCRPEPLCAQCPVQSCCRALAEGRQNEIPLPVRRPAITEVVEIAVAVERDGAYLLRRRSVGERWAGLWDFVRFAAPAKGRITAAWLGRKVRECSGIDVRIDERLPDIRHSVTRYRVTLQCYHAAWEAGDTLDEWVAPGCFGVYPLSKPARKLAEELQQKRLFTPPPESEPPRRPAASRSR